MAILMRWSALGRTKKGPAALLLVGLAGCAIVGALSPREKPFAFSHKLHVVEQELGCVDCHTRWESSDEPGMPVAAQCALCHDELDAAKPPERKVDTFFEDKKFKAARAGAQSDEIVFSHLKHATRGVDCTGCHGSLAGNDVVDAGLRLSMESCQKCHAERNGPADCAACHTTIRTDVPPPSHRLDWKRGHGPAVRACSEEKSARCDLCHQESSCIACHRAEAPANHNGHWRLRGHGLAASMDRKSCSTCHEPESCTSCHATTEPLNHTGAWGSPQDRHCITCHQPLRSEESCWACHKSTPSHQLATPLPSTHVPSMNCRQCHGNGQPLLHPDNGDVCTECHH